MRSALLLGPKLWSRIIRKQWDIVWRALLCLALGGLFLMTDEGTTFDTRFQLRGEKKSHQKISVITLHTGEFNRGSELAQEIREFSDVTDSFYWDPVIWKELLQKILDQKPKMVLVTFFFADYLQPQGEKIGSLVLAPHSIFHDPRIIWGALSNQSDRALYPLLAKYDHSNVGGLDLIRDQDGVIRIFAPEKDEVPHLIEKASRISSKARPLRINYLGGLGTFVQHSGSDVLTNVLPKDAFKDQYVIIGPESISSTQYLTPFGPQNRPTLFAHLLENSLSQNWIRNFPPLIYFLLLVGLEILCIFIISQYPHRVAFVLLAWIGTAIAAISAWVFDTFSIWIPVFSPLLLILGTWIIFIGHQANKIELRNRKLREEQTALQELEQLKNNFVSLISHDLKTPIAKIHGAVDRMLTVYPEPEIQDDLKKLGTYSEELNRYIQSILKLLRVESRDFRLSLEVGDINEEIEKVLEQVRPLAQAKKMNIVTSLEPLFSIEADMTLIHEVILNLVENAIKYSLEGQEIHIHSYEREEYVCFAVQDRGPGISPEDIDRVWDKFTRGKDQDLKTKGSGLGLYLVRYFVELHGGSVKLESTPGQGTRVSFELPMEAHEFKKQEI